jgi:hypothetical protein
MEPAGSVPGGPTLETLRGARPAPSTPAPTGRWRTVRAELELEPDGGPAVARDAPAVGDLADQVETPPRVQRRVFRARLQDETPPGVGDVHPQDPAPDLGPEPDRLFARQPRVAHAVRHQLADQQPGIFAGALGE